MENIFILVIFFAAAYGFQKFIQVVISGFFKSRIETAISELEKYVADNHDEIKSDDAKKKLEEEISNFFLLEKKKKSLGIITKIIGWIELVLFAFLTIVITRNEQRPIEILQFLGLASSGWTALKVFGSYYQWSGAILGRTSYYIFFIGTLLSILAGIIIGYAFNRFIVI